MEGYNCITMVNSTDEATRSAAEKFSCEYPRLVLFFSAGKFQEGVILADNKKIDSNANDIIHSCLVFLACYFVFEIEYPSAWSNFLVFLEYFVLSKFRCVSRQPTTEVFKQCKQDIITAKETLMKKKGINQTAK